MELLLSQCSVQIDDDTLALCQDDSIKQLLKRKQVSDGSRTQTQPQAVAQSPTAITVAPAVGKMAIAPELQGLTGQVTASKEIGSTDVSKVRINRTNMDQLQEWLGLDCIGTETSLNSRFISTEIFGISTLSVSGYRCGALIIGDAEPQEHNKIATFANFLHAVCSFDVTWNTNPNTFTEKLGIFSSPISSQAPSSSRSVAPQGSKIAKLLYFAGNTKQVGSQLCLMPGDAPPTSYTSDNCIPLSTIVTQLASDSVLPIVIIDAYRRGDENESGNESEPVQLVEQLGLHTVATSCGIYVVCCVSPQDRDGRQTTMKKLFTTRLLEGMKGARDSGITGTPFDDFVGQASEAVQYDSNGTICPVIFDSTEPFALF